jgi:hypothetical protein
MRRGKPYKPQKRRLKMKIATIAKNCTILTKKSNEWNNRTNNTRGITYNIGFLYGDDLFTLTCDADTYNSVSTNTAADIEIVSQDGQYARISISRVFPVSAEPKNGSSAKQG